MKRRKENILRTSLPLFSASFVGQGVNFLLVFLLSFLFGADDIGQFFVFLAVGHILIPLVSLQSHNAIVLSRDHHAAFSNFLISIIFGALFSIIVLIFTLLFYFCKHSATYAFEKYKKFYRLPILGFRVDPIMGKPSASYILHSPCFSRYFDGKK